MSSARARLYSAMGDDPTNAVGDAINRIVDAAVHEIDELERQLAEKAQKVNEWRRHAGEAECRAIVAEARVLDAQREIDSRALQDGGPGFTHEQPARGTREPQPGDRCRNCGYDRQNHDDLVHCGDFQLARVNDIADRGEGKQHPPRVVSVVDSGEERRRGNGRGGGEPGHAAPEPGRGPTTPAEPLPPTIGNPHIPSGRDQVAVWDLSERYRVEIGYEDDGAPHIAIQEFHNGLPIVSDDRSTSPEQITELARLLLNLAQEQPTFLPGDRVTVGGHVGTVVPIPARVRVELDNGVVSDYGIEFVHSLDESTSDGVA